MKTDLQIQQDVIAELKWEPKINAAHIGVEVKNGVVTLSGHVDNYAEKWAAEDAAKRVTGVKIIAVEVDVILPTSSKKSDTEIAYAVQNSLKWNIYNLSNNINVKVEDGLVTLGGSVEWHYQKDSAENSVRFLTGVRGVFNNITVKPKISVFTVMADIEKALKRRAHDDAQEITVDVNGDEVTLGGKIHNWSEKNLAIDAAWAVPGVKKVIDKTRFV